MSATPAALPTRRKRTRSLACMQMDRVVGWGTFGVVYKAIDKSTPDRSVVALKKIKMQQEKQGFPLTAIREIKILNTMKHENVVHLREVVTYIEGDEQEEASLIGHADLAYGDVFMVFEYVDFDLSKLLQSHKFRLGASTLKSYLFQLLQGVNYLHENRILHRDIKSANLLITRGNVLKIADWGLARSIPQANHRLTVPVVTLWYRCPELILGRNQYGPEIDMWSVGCIFAEMATRVALFPGDTDLVQLELIFSLLGNPQGPLVDTYKAFPQFEALAPKKTLHPRLASRMSQFLDAPGVAMLAGLLDLDPSRRLTAAAALQHPYFTPPPADPKSLPVIQLTLGTESEAETKKQEQLHQQQLRYQKAQLLQLQQHAAHVTHGGAAAAGPAGAAAHAHPHAAPRAGPTAPHGAFDAKRDTRPRDRKPGDPTAPSDEQLAKRSKPL